MVYDGNGNIVCRYMPLQKEAGWKYTYDLGNRMTQVISPEGMLLNSFTSRYIRGYELISSDSEKARMYYQYTTDEMGVSPMS